MILKKVKIMNYRSIIDTEWFDIEDVKSILVGPNEAGKTVILKALQQLNPPKGIPGFDPLRDYPRSLYNDLEFERDKILNSIIVEGEFHFEASDKEKLPSEYADSIYIRKCKLNNSIVDTLKQSPELPSINDIEKDFLRLIKHIEDRQTEITKTPTFKELFTTIFTNYNNQKIEGSLSEELQTFLKDIFPEIEENNTKEEQRYDKLLKTCSLGEIKSSVLKYCSDNVPIFVLFSNYFKVRPIIHLQHLADRIDSGILDDEQYDYGNNCLLKLLGFTARELSDLGNVAMPAAGDPAALKIYRDQLDQRSYRLNAAYVKLTEEVKKVWNPNDEKGEANKLVIKADGQYLKVVVEDELGVEIELDQRSEGFQWIVSFFVVFFAESMDKHKNSILLLDEPGTSLHGLKQLELRKTLSILGERNQIIFTTHSPFLVGPDELDFVRVVELNNRKVGTKVHSTICATDPAAMLPLQEALGYSLAQSLFVQEKNLILEGLTDYWYIEALSNLISESKGKKLDEDIAMIPANSASKVVYFATLLHAQKMKVVALLDSDKAGDQVANQETLIHLLGNKSILRTKDVYQGDVITPEIEDLLRETLIDICKNQFGVDAKVKADSQSKRPIVDLLNAEIKDFSKYKLAKAFLRWARENSYSDLKSGEFESAKKLLLKINKALG